MQQQKGLQYAANIGETLVTIAAAMWITHQPLVPYLFAVGTAMFVVARIWLGQPKAAPLWLTAAAVLIFFTHPTYVGVGIYIMPSTWIAAFVGFVVNEVYYAFRK